MVKLKQVSSTSSINYDNPNQLNMLQGRCWKPGGLATLQEVTLPLNLLLHILPPSIIYNQYTSHFLPSYPKFLQIFLPFLLPSFSCLALMPSSSSTSTFLTAQLTVSAIFLSSMLPSIAAFAYIKMYSPVVLGDATC